MLTASRYGAGFDTVEIKSTDSNFQEKMIENSAPKAPLYKVIRTAGFHVYMTPFGSERGYILTPLVAQFTLAHVPELKLMELGLTCNHPLRNPRDEGAIKSGEKMFWEQDSAYHTCL